MNRSFSRLSPLLAIFLVLIFALCVYVAGVPSTIESKAAALEELGCVVSYGKRGGWRIKIPKTIEVKNLSQDLLDPFGTHLSGTQKPAFIEFEHLALNAEDCDFLRNLSGNIHVIVQENALSSECVEHVREGSKLLGLFSKNKSSELTPLLE